MIRSGLFCSGASVEAIFCVFLILCCFSVSADVLPGEVPENQLWTTTSLIDGVGITTESTSLNWHTSDAGFDSLPTPFFDENRIISGSIAYAIYKDSIISNGGQISEVKTFSLDTSGKTEGLYNIETEKVLTYTSQNGSHLMGEEYYLLDVMGQWSVGTSSLVCVFSRSERDVIPAFCNKVTASSKLRSITTAQIESIGSATVIGTDTQGESPAALRYDISVVPDANSVSGFAEGIVSTTFTVSVMEGRSDGAVQTEPDPLGVGGIFSGGIGQILWQSSGSEGVTRIGLVRTGGYDYVGVLYNGQLYETTLNLQGRFMPSVGGIGIVRLPPEAQLTFDGGTSSTDTYTVTYMGAMYSLEAWRSSDVVGALHTLIQPASLHLEHYDELAARLNSIDTATVSGGISNFVKSFNYVSGIKCTSC